MKQIEQYDTFLVIFNKKQMGSVADSCSDNGHLGIRVGAHEVITELHGAVYFFGVSICGRVNHITVNCMGCENGGTA